MIRLINAVAKIVALEHDRELLQSGTARTTIKSYEPGMDDVAIRVRQTDSIANYLGKLLSVSSVTVHEYTNGGHCGRYRTAESGEDCASLQHLDLPITRSSYAVLANRPQDFSEGLIVQVFLYLGPIGRNSMLR